MAFRRPSRPRDNLRAAVFLLALLTIAAFYGYRSATTFARFEKEYVPLALDKDAVTAISRGGDGAVCTLKSGATVWIVQFRDARYGHSGRVDDKLFVGDRLTKKACTLELYVNNELAIDGATYMASRPVDPQAPGWAIIALVAGLLAVTVGGFYALYYEVMPRLAQARERREA